MDIPVINFTPSRGNDKHVRVNSVAPLFESGKIWAPMHEHFAQEVVEECAAFRLASMMTMWIAQRKLS
jgi:phage terminase large subunit-like protein